MSTSTPLSRAERSHRTRSLLQQAFDCTDAVQRRSLLDQVVVVNCRVADAVAMRYRDRGVPLEDLQQAAYEGLVKAVRRYDPTHADDLLTFAVPTIRGEVQRHFRDRSWMVRPPRRLQELQAQVDLAWGHLRDELGREPDAGEVGARVGIDRAEYAEVMASYGCFTPVSLDRPLGALGSGTFGDLVADEGSDFEAAEARCMVESAVRRLGRRDREVLFLRFHEERTHREIGAELGISQTQVGRVIDRLLSRLRHLVEQGGPAYDVLGRPA